MIDDISKTHALQQNVFTATSLQREVITSITDTETKSHREHFISALCSDFDRTQLRVTKIKFLSVVCASVLSTAK